MTLTSEQKTELFKLVNEGNMTQKAIAEKFGLHQSSVSQMIKRAKTKVAAVASATDLTSSSSKSSEVDDISLLLRTKIRQAESQIRKWENALKAIEN